MSKSFTLNKMTNDLKILLCAIYNVVIPLLPETDDSREVERLSLSLFLQVIIRLVNNNWFGFKNTASF